jgi:hypothetical protein
MLDATRAHTLRRIGALGRATLGEATAGKRTGERLTRGLRSAEVGMGLTVGRERIS